MGKCTVGGDDTIVLVGLYLFLWAKFLQSSAFLLLPHAMGVMDSSTCLDGPDELRQLPILQADESDINSHRKLSSASFAISSMDISSLSTSCQIFFFVQFIFPRGILFGDG